MGPERRIGANAPAAGRPQTADPAGGQGGFRLGPQAASRAAINIEGIFPQGQTRSVPRHHGRGRLRHTGRGFQDATARVHRGARKYGSVAAGSPRAAADDAGDRVPQHPIR
jgi:hypothetical protein